MLNSIDYLQEIKFKDLKDSRIVKGIIIVSLTSSNIENTNTESKDKKLLINDECQVIVSQNQQKFVINIWKIAKERNSYFLHFINWEKSFLQLDKDVTL